MSAPSAPLVLTVLAAALAGAGCRSGARTSGPPLVEAALVETGDVELSLDPGGPWREADASEALAARHSPAPADPPAPAAPSAAPALLARPEAPRLAPPQARGLGEVAASGQPPVKAVADVARERFLDHPTEIEAESVTLYLPADLAAEAHLTGGALSEPSPGRRVAEGEARLVCRELTLRGSRITLRVRSGASRDVQITARGNVAFVSRQRDQVLREQGLTSLILTNDQVTPLR